MKQSACMVVAVMAWTMLHAADSTNAPPSEAAAPAATVLASDPKDSAAEVLGLRRIRDTLARRPAEDGGDALRDWLTEVVVRCEQFLDDQPRSTHAAEVRAVDAQCRLELSTLTNERAEHDKALQLAKQALAKNDRSPGAARARLVLVNAAWPEDLATVIDQSRLIVRDFPDHPLTAEALWWLARAQQRKGDERAVREAVLALFGSFPQSPEAAQARMLLRQLGLAAQPAPSLSLKTVDGKSIDLDTLHGQAVVLDFWTAATLPASEGSGVLRRSFEAHHEGALSVIGINLDTDRATFDKANAAHPTPWPQVFANDPANAKLTEAYPALVAPTRLLLDPFGTVARIAAHPAEIEPLMKRWQSTGAVASSAGAAKPSSAGTVKPPAVAVKKEAPKTAAARLSEPALKPKPPVEKRSVASAKPSPKPAVTAPAEKQAATPPTPPPTPAPQPTHIEIGGVLYAKPLSVATNAIPVESTKPVVKITSPVTVSPVKPPSPTAKPFASTEKLAKLNPTPSAVPSEPTTAPGETTASKLSPAVKRFTDEEKPLKSSHPAARETAKAEIPATPPPAPATRPASTPPLKSHSGYGSSSAKTQPAGEEKPSKADRPLAKDTAKAESPATRSASTLPLKSHSGYGSSSTKTQPADEAKPPKASHPAAKETAKAESPAAPPPAPATRSASATPVKSHSGYGSSSAKSKLKENAESLATMPDISEADRRAAMMDAAKRILKSEEELITWSELEAFFTTKKPASVEGSLAWYQDVADRCQQFIKDYPKSPHVNLVRINEARCRLAVFKATQDGAQRVRAETAAHEVLGHKPNEDDAIRAEFLLLNATWPDHPEQGIAIAKGIVKDFPHRPETAAAILMQAQFRRRQGMLQAAKDAASDLLKLFPESGFAFNARSLIKQCDLLNNPCPPLKLTGLHGEKMNSEACKGKPLLIEFWSPSSRSALEDAAKLVQLYVHYQPKGFEIYTICVDKSREAMDIFQLQHPLPWPVYWDGAGLQGPVCQQFGVDNAGMRFMLEPGLQRIVSTHLSPEGVAAALNLWIDRNQPPPLPGQEPPAQGFFQKFFGLKF